MDEINIFWTSTARKQRDQIFQYWNKRNGNSYYSQKLNLEIRERSKILKMNPEIGKPTNFESTRILIMKHYSIVYKLALPKIIITAFWDNRKDPKQLLDLLKKS